MLVALPEGVAKEPSRNILLHDCSYGHDSFAFFNNTWRTLQISSHLPVSSIVTWCWKHRVMILREICISMLLSMVKSFITQTHLVTSWKNWCCCLPQALYLHVWVSGWLFLTMPSWRPDLQFAENVSVMSDISNYLIIILKKSSTTQNITNANRNLEFTPTIWMQQSSW